MARQKHKDFAKLRRLEWLLSNGPCAYCGSWDRLEVDHINPEDKITHKFWGWSKDRREAELAKCQPLCHDCHWTKTLQERRPRLLKSHGTPARYRGGCRCKQCRLAQSIYAAELRIAKRSS